MANLEIKSNYATELVLPNDKMASLEKDWKPIIPFYSQDIMFLIPYDSTKNIPFNVSIDRIYCIDCAIYIERREDMETVFLGEYNTKEEAENIAYTIERSAVGGITMRLPDPNDTNLDEIKWVRIISDCTSL